MSQYAVTSLLSPRDNYLILYEVRNEQQQVAISRFELDDAKVAFAYKQRPEPTGPINHPADIASAYSYGIPTVYGWVDLPPDKAKDGGDATAKSTGMTVLSQISPSIYTFFDEDKKALGKRPGTSSALAAVTDGEDKLYLYYFVPTGSGDTPLKLHSHHINKLGDPVTEDHSGASNYAGAKSRMAGVALKKEPGPGKNVVDRAVVFQLKEKKGPLFSKLIENTTDSKTGTPISLVHWEGKIYLYYLDSKGSLMRAVGEKGGNLWSQPKPVVGTDSDDGAPREDTGLSATAAAKGNYLFYVRSQETDPTKFTCILDER